MHEPDVLLAHRLFGKLLATPFTLEHGITAAGGSGASPDMERIDLLFMMSETALFALETLWICVDFHVISNLKSEKNSEKLKKNKNSVNLLQKPLKTSCHKFRT